MSLGSLKAALESCKYWYYRRGVFGGVDMNLVGEFFEVRIATNAIVVVSQRYFVRGIGMHTPWIPQSSVGIVQVLVLQRRGVGGCIILFLGVRFLDITW
jgi:hypothetical protein